MNTRFLPSVPLTAVLLVSCGSSQRFAASATPGIPEGPHQLSGIASYYSDEFNGKKTANGETFDMLDFTAAHRTLPFNTVLKVTNLDNGKGVQVRVNDRGPFVGNRVIDLSLGAAREIGLVSSGTARVSLEIVEMGPSK